MSERSRGSLPPRHAAGRSEETTKLDRGSPHPHRSREASRLFPLPSPRETRRSCAARRILHDPHCGCRPRIAFWSSWFRAVALYLEPALSDAMRLISVQLSVNDFTIRKPNRGETFHLPPLASAKLADKAGVSATSTTGRDRLDVADSPMTSN